MPEPPSSSDDTRKKLEEHPILRNLAAIARGEKEDDGLSKYNLRQRALQSLREKESKE